MDSSKGGAKKKKSIVEALRSDDIPVDTTEPGQKKDVSGDMPAAYHPSYVESSWYEWWEKSGVFQPKAADPSTPDKEKFVIVFPPPNVTGSLHLGHALTVSIQDALVRWHRMRGDTTLWVPGIDHAGIATQTVVEKKLNLEKKISRHELGREAFISEVWKWKAEYGDRIVHQLRRTGASMDWSRSAFTLDEPRSASVKEAFVRFFEDGLIFRDIRLVNWCSALKSAISDIEVEYIELEKETYLRVPGHEPDRTYPFGCLWSFAYKVVDDPATLPEGTPDEIVVSTTRPETMLGDTAVAVHPEDVRYRNLIGRLLQHPFIPERRIPVIGDSELVDPTFGTGAVKVTPAHDPNDYQCGKRHKLPFINVFADDGTLNENGGEFAGLKRFEVRRMIVKRLEELKLFRGKKDHKLRLGVCSRTNDVVEPMIKPQWFVNCQSMAARAMEATRVGELTIVPQFHESTWYHFMGNIHDWCISRQLWWGHRIPAYEIIVRDAADTDSPLSDPNSIVSVDGSGLTWTDAPLADRWVVARSDAEAVEVAKARMLSKFNISEDRVTLKQDDDVLDTWFSSGLFPFSVFNWPNSAADAGALSDLERFYPTSLMETGHDILFFWVARMVMMGLQLTGKLPFNTVYLHAMVRDKYGRKMSKTLGNVIDPLDVVSGISLEELHGKLLTGNLDPREVERARSGQKEQFPDGIAVCGSDALRFALLAYTAQGRDINLDINRIHGYRTFCNKIWNAVKFAKMQFGPDFAPTAAQVRDVVTPGTALFESLSNADRWVLGRLHVAIKTTTEGLEQFQFAQSTTACYSFWLYELCDVYLELIKSSRSTEEDAQSQAQQATSRLVLFFVLETSLRLLHPFMPFLTEELWQRLPHPADDDITKRVSSICLAAYPDHNVAQWVDAVLEERMQIVLSVSHMIRSLKADYHIPTARVLDLVYVRTRSADLEQWLSGNGGSSFVGKLAGVKDVKALLLTGDHAVDSAAVPAGAAIAVVSELIEVCLPLRGVVDAEAELRKLTARQTALNTAITKMEQRLSTATYRERVPREVQDAEQQKVEAQKLELQSVINAMGALNACL